MAAGLWKECEGLDFFFPEVFTLLSGVLRSDLGRLTLLFGEIDVAPLAWLLGV
jgi:hypothetical protein